MVRVGILVLFLISRRRLQLFPIEDDICYGFFIDGFYEVEECSLYPYTLNHFNQEQMLYLVKCFFLHQEQISKRREKNHMVLSINAEKAFDKIENLFPD